MIRHNAQAGRTGAKKLISLNGQGGLETLPLILGRGRDVSHQVGLPDADSLMTQNDIPRMEGRESPYLNPRRNSSPYT